MLPPFADVSPVLSTPHTHTQVMALLAYLYEFKQNYGPHLIIVPNAVMVNWKAELQTWLPDFRCVYYTGAKDERHLKFQQVGRTAHAPGLCCCPAGTKSGLCGVWRSGNASLWLCVSASRTCCVGVCLCLLASGQVAKVPRQRGSLLMCCPPGVAVCVCLQEVQSMQFNILVTTYETIMRDR